MTEAEKAYQYFVIAVPENEEQAKAYFWARKALQSTLTQPNEPLTLDELREMDGEPVWGQSLITEKLGEWFILRVVEMSKTWFIACAGAAQGFGDKDTYGKTWLAYRRPPEGEEEEKHVIEITENL